MFCSRLQRNFQKPWPVRASRETSELQHAGLPIEPLSCITLFVLHWASEAIAPTSSECIQCHVAVYVEKQCPQTEEVFLHRPIQPWSENQVV